MATEELKLVISAEERASREIDRLQSKLKSFQGRMSKAFSTPLNTGILNSKAVTDAFAKYGAGLSQINERHTRQANNERRQNRMTYTTYEALNKQLGEYINKQGQITLRSQKQRDAFVDLTRKVRAYEQVWGRQHERYLSSLRREQEIKDQVERAKERLGNLGFVNEQRRRATLDALDRQRSRAFLASERDKETARRSLDRQRSRAYIAQIREEERLGRKANADKLREELRAARAQESARRSLDRQRSQAFIAEENRKQRLRINSMNLQMRQEARAQREAERREEAIHRGRVQSVRGGAQAIGSMPGRVVSAAIPIAVAAGAVTAAVVKAAESGFSARRSTSTAEANMVMFGDVKGFDEVNRIRREWLDMAGVANGFAPSAGMNAYTEVKKAGIGKDNEDVVKTVTMSIMKGAAGLDLNIPETTKLVGRLSTLTQNPNSFDAGAIDKMLNGLAVVAKYTAADSNELVSSLRRGAGVLGSSKMSVADLTAFTGTGISAGMQEGKAGTFMDFQVNELVNAKNARGQRRTDLAKGLKLAGFNGGLGAVSRQMATDPTGALTKLYGNMAKMSPEKAGQVATLIGMREWRGEMLQMMKAFPTLVEALKEVRDSKNDDHLQKANDLKMGTISGVLSQINALSKLLWEAVGKGLEEPFREVSKFFLAYGKGLNLDVIQAHVKTLIDGFVDGMGFKSITEVLETLFGKPGQFDFSTVNTWFRFAQGFGRGIKDVIDTFKGLFSTKDMDPEKIGEWAAKIGAWSVALVAAAPAITLLGALTTGLVALFAVISGASAAIGLLGTLSGAAAAVGTGGAAATGAAGFAALFGAAFIPVTIVGITAAAIAAWFGGREAVKLLTPPGNMHKQPEGPMDSLAEELGRSIRPRVQRQSFESEDNPLAGLIHKASYTGYDDRSDAVERLGAAVQTMGARFQLASLSGTSLGSGLGVSLGGGGGGGGGSVGGSGSSFGKNFFTPGGSVPSWYGKGSGSGAGSSGGGKAGALGVPDIGPMTADERNKLGLIMKYEGGYKNQMNYMGKRQGLDPNTAKGYTAQGYYQILNSNWRRLAPKLGITTTNAMSSSLEDQTKVALALMRENPNRPGGGIQNWSNYNPALRAALARGEQAPAGRVPGVDGGVAGISPNLGGLTPSLNGLRIKSGEATAGGATHPAILAAAQMIQNGNMAGGVNRFTAFNDLYHKGTGSKHASGLAGDFTLKDASKSGAAAEQVRQMFRSAGLPDDAFKVIDEYRNPSRRATGGHIHYQINSAKAAAQYAEAVSRRSVEAARAVAATAESANRANAVSAGAAPGTTGDMRGTGFRSTGWQPGAGTANRSAITGVPERAERAISNVPMPPRRPAGVGGAGGSAGGGVQIVQNIHGGQNNPQEIANLSQRQITKDWNHRSHDVEFDMA
jgi:hypothetical protein